MNARPARLVSVCLLLAFQGGGGACTAGDVGDGGDGLDDEAAGTAESFLVGDANGDHKADIAVRRGHCAAWDENRDGRGEHRHCFGVDGDRYLVGDWDGDGTDDL